MKASSLEEWPLHQLGALATSVDYGHTASANLEPVGPKFLRITDIQDDYVDWSTVPFCECDAESQGKLALQPGDIVFARTGSTGKSFLLRTCPANAVFASYLIRVRPNTTLVDPRYLAWFFQAPSYWAQISKTSVGTIQSGVNASKLRELLVPVPPMDKQKRIATLLDKADAIRRKRQKAIALTEQLLRSTFLEMFGDPVTNPKRWPETPLGETLTLRPQLGTTTPAHDGGKYPVVRVGELGSRDINLEDCGRVTLEGADLERFRCQPGDLLLARAIGSAEQLGKASLVGDSSGPVIFDSHVMRLRLNASLAIPSFIFHWLNSTGGRARFLRRAGRTAVQFNVNAEQISGVVLPLPPLAQQERWHRFELRALQTVRRLQTSRSESDTLFYSLVQRAFSGQL